MADQDLYDLIQSADPATLKMMMAAGLAPQRIGLMNEQPTAQGRTVGPHNVYVASSPLEHLSNAFRQGVQQKLLGDVQKGREAYLRTIAGRGGAPGELPAAPQMVGDDLQPLSQAGAAPQMLPDAPRPQGMNGPFRPGQGYPGMPDAQVPPLSPDVLAQILGG